MSGFECFNLEDVRTGGHWVTRRDGVWAAQKEGYDFPIEDLRAEMTRQLLRVQEREKLLLEMLGQVGGVI